MNTNVTVLKRSQELQYDMVRCYWVMIAASAGSLAGASWEQVYELATRLMQEHHREFEQLLPAGCTWNLRDGAILGPPGVGLHDIGIGFLLETSKQNVMERLNTIQEAYSG